MGTSLGLGEEKFVSDEAEISSRLIETIKRIRAALRLRGIETGVGRQPQSLVQQQELTKLSDQLQCLLAAEGFTREPIGGCPVGDGVDAGQVSRIVETVVSELKKRGMA